MLQNSIDVSSIKTIYQWPYQRTDKIFNIDGLF